MKKNLEMHLELSARELGKSVIRVNPRINEDAAVKDENALYFGIKNTNQIPYEIFDKLRLNKRFLWHTVDKMADKGRSIDTDLVNPLTYRAMTGSTSGGAINILKGINDFAVGTDGGGSILGPAMSCQLPSMIGAGLDVYVNSESLSTDSIKLRGSVGVIAKNLDMVIDAFEEILGKSFEREQAFDSDPVVVVPEHGTIETPEHIDMTEKLLPYIRRLQELHCKIKFVDFSGIGARQTGINKIEEAFEKHHADIILTYEGPIDVYGYGETIPEMFGETGKHLTENSGKFLMRAANICHTTAITVPTNDIASGLLVIAKHGYENAVKAVYMARKLETMIKLPEVWKRYYLTNERFNKGFELKDNE